MFLFSGNKLFFVLRVEIKMTEDYNECETMTGGQVCKSPADIPQQISVFHKDPSAY